MSIQHCFNCDTDIDTDNDVEHFDMCYTKEHIKECLAYLNYCVKEGAIDAEEAKEMAEKKNWKEVYDMMGYGEYLADLAFKGGDY